jgi:hypothetical protein
MQALAVILNGKAKCNPLAGSFISGEVEECKLSSRGEMVLNGKNGVDLIITTSSGESIAIWWPYGSAANKSNQICDPSQGKSCPVFIKIDGKYEPGNVSNTVNACDGSNNAECYVARMTDASIGVITWINPIRQNQSGSQQLANAPLSDPDLGPVFKTVGLDRQMQTVRKYHQVLLSSMRKGRNLLGHGMVEMHVLSYDPRDYMGVRYWLRVNCVTREWKFIENDAKLMGGGLEMFGAIQGNQMGPWACNRFGYSY